MAKYDPAYDIVARHEGGYQNNPNDSGNYNSLNQAVGTNYGISAKVYEKWIGRPPSESDMRNMSRSTAKEIFWTYFWTVIRGDEIQSQPVANIFLDGAVNHGTTGIKIMQRVLAVDQDGIVGPHTLQVLNAANPPQVYAAYRQARREFYYDLVKRKPANAVFLNGWLRRINSFQELSSDNGIVAGVKNTAEAVVGAISEVFDTANEQDMGFTVLHLVYAIAAACVLVLAWFGFSLTKKAKA